MYRRQLPIMSQNGSDHERRTFWCAAWLELKDVTLDEARWIADQLEGMTLRLENARTFDAEINRVVLDTSLQ